MHGPPYIPIAVAKSKQGPCEGARNRHTRLPFDAHARRKERCTNHRGATTESLGKNFVPPSSVPQPLLRVVTQDDSAACINGISQLLFASVP